VSDAATSITLTGTDILNWAAVVNGTVEVGVGAALEGHVSFSGASEGPQWVREFEVRFFNSTTGNETLWSPVNRTTDEHGNFTIESLNPGTYDIGVKNWTCLSDLVSNVTLIAGETKVVDFGTTREGDVDNNDVVNILDASSLVTAWLSNPTRPNWNPNCDFNRDMNVNILDASALASNFGESGDLV